MNYHRYIIPVLLAVCIAMTSYFFKSDAVGQDHPLSVGEAALVSLVIYFLTFLPSTIFLIEKAELKGKKLEAAMAGVLIALSLITFIIYSLISEHYQDLVVALYFNALILSIPLGFLIKYPEDESDKIQDMKIEKKVKVIELDTKSLESINYFLKSQLKLAVISTVLLGLVWFLCSYYVNNNIQLIDGGKYLVMAMVAGLGVASAYFSFQTARLLFMRSKLINQ